MYQKIVVAFNAGQTEERKRTKAQLENMAKTMKGKVRATASKKAEKKHKKVRENTTVANDCQSG